MVTRFPPGAQPHKPAAQPATPPATPPAPTSAAEAGKAEEKDHACTCGGKCGGAGKSKPN